MKISNADIEKYATLKEKKQLKRGRPSKAENLKKLKKRKTEAVYYLRLEIENMSIYLDNENWEDLHLEISDALSDMNRIIKYEEQIKDLEIKLKIRTKEDEEPLF
jgi:hypothetical protein